MKAFIYLADQSDAQATPALSQRDISLFLGESIRTRRYIETIQYQTEGKSGQMKPPLRRRHGSTARHVRHVMCPYSFSFIEKFVEICRDW